jgi:hypothetical protein
MGTGSILGVQSGRGVTLTAYPLLVPRSRKKSTAIPLLSIRAFVAYDRVKPTYNKAFIFVCTFVKIISYTYML